MDQKAIKAKYMDIICTEVWKNSPDMQKYASDRYGYGVELDDGDIAVIEKPYIKKDFCFGYGWYGRADEEESNRASDMVRHAETSEEYFISQNLEEMNKKIEVLNDPRMAAYKGIAYIGQPEDSKLKTICFYWAGNEDDPKTKGLVKLTDGEVQAMINGYEENKKLFKKRLDRYLKRYGLSKINAWSYLRD